MKRGQSILVVEDYPEMQDLLKMILEQEGYQVTPALNGQEGLEFLNAPNDFALVLLDYTLPDMNAQLFLTKARECETGRSVPFILCSAASAIKEIELPQGVVGIVPKPFKIDDLLKVVKNNGLRDAGDLRLGA